MSGRAAVALAAMIVAGCLAPSGPTAVPTSVDASLDGTQPLEILPGERAAVASISLREEFKGGRLVPFALGSDVDDYPPRDVVVTFHGLQDVYDEFARPVRAFIFRGTEMVLVHNSTFDLASQQFLVTTRWEEHRFEYVFDAADGRSLGVSDLTDGARFYADPSHRSPFASILVLFMALKQVGDERGRPIAAGEQDGSALSYRFEPYDGARPIPGDCAMWSLTSRYEPPLQTDHGQVSDAGSPFYGSTVVCLEEGAVVPLWTYASLDDTEYRLTRTTAAFALPAFRGEALAPVPHERRPWQETRGALGLPVPAPMLVPPGADGGRLASAIADRAAAFHLHAGYAQYRQGSDVPYTELAWAGVPRGGLRVLGVPVPMSALSQASDESSLFFLSDGVTHFAGNVHSRVGTAEQPDVHVADPLSSTSPVLSATMTAADLPHLVPDAPLEGQLSPLLPEDHAAIVFLATSFGTRPVVHWSVFGPCEGEPGLAAVVNGVTGAAVASVMMQPGDPVCDHGSSFAFTARPVLRPAGLGPAPQPFEGWPLMPV